MKKILLLVLILGSFMVNGRADNPTLADTNRGTRIINGRLGIDTNGATAGYNLYYIGPGLGFGYQANGSGGSSSNSYVLIGDVNISNAVSGAVSGTITNNLSLRSGVVTTNSGTQTITGNKTFSGNMILSGTLSLSGIQSNTANTFFLGNANTSSNLTVLGTVSLPASGVAAGTYTNQIIVIGADGRITSSTEFAVAAGSSQVLTNGVNLYGPLSTNLYPFNSSITMNRTVPYGTGTNAPLVIASYPYRYAGGAIMILVTNSPNGLQGGIAIGQDTSIGTGTSNMVVGIFDNAGYVQGPKGQSLILAGNNAQTATISLTATAIALGTGDNGSGATLILGLGASTPVTVNAKPWATPNGISFGSGVLTLPSSTAGTTTNGATLSVATGNSTFNGTNLFPIGSVNLVGTNTYTGPNGAPLMVFGADNVAAMHIYATGGSGVHDAAIILGSHTNQNIFDNASSNAVIVSENRSIYISCGNGGTVFLRNQGQSGYAGTTTTATLGATGGVSPTLGAASSDTLTINPTTVSIPNGVRFASGGLYLPSSTSGASTNGYAYGTPGTGGASSPVMGQIVTNVSSHRSSITLSYILNAAVGDLAAAKIATIDGTTTNYTCYEQVPSGISGTFIKTVTFQVGPSQIWWPTNFSGATGTATIETNSFRRTAL